MHPLLMLSLCQLNALGDGSRSRVDLPAGCSKSQDHLIAIGVSICDSYWLAFRIHFLVTIPEVGPSRPVPNRLFTMEQVFRHATLYRTQDIHVDPPLSP